MKILVTGSNGFIAKNLIAQLSTMDDIEVLKIDKNHTDNELSSKVLEADFIYHLAGINRPKNTDEFYEGNSSFTKQIVKILENHDKSTPILMSSSIQVTQDNDYGKSKLEAENILAKYTLNQDTVSYIYRLPNVFGKYSKPNYNSVIATWCYNICRDLPIEISDKNVELTLVYVDDVVDSFIKHIYDNATQGVLYPNISPAYKKTLGEINELLIEFKENRQTLLIPRVGRGFERALYATFLSYLPIDKFSYSLKGYQDERGAFYEFVKTMDSGQFSVSTTAPGVTRGNHFHHTKNEKFLVVKGKASIKFRKIDSDEVIEYIVSDKTMEVVEMIPGYTHNITNIGDEEMILLLWANEIFEQEKPDTYFLEV
jgi:UDP-2-acetamido-2,6-beta-L-arabino-hexul-4-ose reductase